MEKPYGIIYKATNIITNESYVGQTVKKLKTRWNEHIRKSIKGGHAFQRAIKEYGKNNFIICQICECESRELLNIMETFYIMVHRAHYTEGGYNLTWGGDGSYVRTKEIIEKCKKPKSELAKQHMRESHANVSGKNNPIYGTKRSKITKEKIGSKNSNLWSITFPNKKKVTSNNLKLFCKENNLSYDCMINVGLGKSNSHRGFICTCISKKKINKILSEKNSYDWIIIYPNGKESIIHNLKLFCEENGLSYNSMRNVSSGKTKFHRNNHKKYRCQKIKIV